MCTALQIESAGDFGLRVYNPVKKSYSILPVDIALNGASNLITVGKGNLAPPYRIENRHVHNFCPEALLQMLHGAECRFLRTVLHWNSDLPAYAMMTLMWLSVKIMESRLLFVLYLGRSSRHIMRNDQPEMKWLICEAVSMTMLAHVSRYSSHVESQV